MSLSVKKCLQILWIVIATAAPAIKATATSSAFTSGQWAPAPPLTHFISKAVHLPVELDIALPKRIDNLKSLVSPSGRPGSCDQECFVQILPGDSRDLLAAMANSEHGCILQLTGEYVFSTFSPVINHRLQAAPPARVPGADTLWYSPVVYTEDGHSIFTSSPGYLPKLKNTQPTATLIIEQGTIHIDSEGELHNIGIVDRRPESGMGVPVITFEPLSVLPVKDRLIHVLFDHHYPVISDITESHPYWHHEEVADQAGRAVRSAGRFFSNLAFSVRGGQRRHASGSGRLFGGGSGGNGGDDPYWHWRVAQRKVKGVFMFQPRRGNMEYLEAGMKFYLVYLGIQAVLLTTATYQTCRKFVSIPSEIQKIEFDQKCFNETLDGTMLRQEEDLSELEDAVDSELNKSKSSTEDM